ncbi:unnamed protein product [Clonostachys rhizophaga]|uniref:Uncharacterized protein n=1 Tax=Clonostachys rhizophaga TaxID=160324 RepID=A0A9N9V371_9HYPO|nr:unnamed protein product [Clonostachys rhizophaga]
MKFSTLVLGLLATSASALLNQGVDILQGVAGDANAPGPRHEPCAESVGKWHPPHDTKTDGCGDFGSGEWHWVPPVRTTTVMVPHVKTIVDCSGPHTTGIQTPEASHIASTTEVHQIPARITLSSVHLGWKGSHGASPTVATYAGSPVPTAVNSSAIHPPHTPATTFQRTQNGYNATTAAPAIPTMSKAPQETSGGISSTYNIGIFALVGFAALLVL